MADLARGRMRAANRKEPNHAPLLPVLLAASCAARPSRLRGYLLLVLFAVPLWVFNTEGPCKHDFSRFEIDDYENASRSPAPGKWCDS